MPRRETADERARGAINQQASRRINDEIAKLRYSASFDSYVCECRRKKCIAPIKLTREEYAEIRRDPRRFVVVPGHASARLERVVLATPGFHIVVAIQPQAPATSPAGVGDGAAGERPSEEPVDTLRS